MPKEFVIQKRGDSYLNVKAWKEHLASLPDGRYLIKIDSLKKRSQPQNKYYWSVVVDLVYQGLRGAGFDAVRNKDDAHEILKALFLKVKEEKHGIKIERVKSTTELKTVEFMEYLQHISIWSFDYLSITIPEPNQQMEMSLDK
jgi:hypothetical protein